MSLRLLLAGPFLSLMATEVMDQNFNNALVAVSAVASSSVPVTRSVNVSLLMKRCFDVLLSALACLTLSPLFGLTVIALLVAQGRPIFVAHKRVGKDGKPFSCLKFRTMVLEGDHLLANHLQRSSSARREWELTRKLRDDPRVTALGATLRASSVDELPQLVNVLLGDMSLVGPRPIVEEELALYGVFACKYLEARPGLTGAWQISGRSNTTFADRVKLDVHYVENRDMAKDLRILLKTIPAVLRSEGAV